MMYMALENIALSVTEAEIFLTFYTVSVIQKLTINERQIKAIILGIKTATANYHRRLNDHLLLVCFGVLVYIVKSSSK